MCFYFECMAGFLEMILTLVLLHNMEIGCLYSTWMSCKVCFIHRNFVYQVATAIYYASTIDKKIDDCFLLNYDTKKFPKNAHSLVLFMSCL